MRGRCVRRLWVGAAWIALFSACGRSAPPPNAILVSFDTLRADALGHYGSTAGATPRLDAYFADSVVFRRAYTPEPQTLSAHASLFTSHHPISHGVAGRLSGGIALPESLPTLAATLSKSGYATAAFVNGGFLHPRFELDRGFDVYDYFSDLEARGAGRAPGRTAAETNEAVFAWLDGPVREPFFLFVHYFDIHSDQGALPYDSPPGYREAIPNLPSSGESGSIWLHRLNRTRAALPPSQLAALRGLYDAGVRYADERFGELLAGLRERGYGDDTLFVVLSDHGEEFQDHGRFLHVQLYDETLRIPLAIRFPERAKIGPREITEPVALVDLMPTLLDALGVVPPAGLQGRSLMPLIADPSLWQPRPLFFLSENTRTLAMRDGRWKAVYDPRTQAVELYDTDADPGERIDLAGSREADTERRARQIRRWLRTAPRAHSTSPTHAVHLDEETAEQLRQLGYMD